MNRQELIAALEAATGASRELDFWCWWWAKARHSGQLPPADYVEDELKHPNTTADYTRSIDAAMTLVQPRYRVELTIDSRRNRTVAVVSDDDRLALGTHATPAISLVIAALRAHA